MERCGALDFLHMHSGNLTTGLYYYDEKVPYEVHLLCTEPELFSMVDN